MVSPMRSPDFVYKVSTRAVYDASIAAGHFKGMPVDARDGYIHLSTAAQLAETLRLHFAGEADLILFAVRSYDLGSGLRWEPSRGGQLFPHHYGQLPMSAVTQRASVTVAADGSATLPGWVK
jgi:uncharacterized protein (DUF952 family)